VIVAVPDGTGAASRGPGACDAVAMVEIATSQMANVRIDGPC
jgi:hypothetical protein